MSKITYALPAFAGQLTADDRHRMGAISRKALRRGVSQTDFDIDDIISSADRKLFSQITHPRHCLHHLLPPKTSAHCSYSLRKRQHYYQLPHVEYSQYKNSFITRFLFNFRWLWYHFNDDVFNWRLLIILTIEYIDYSIIAFFCFYRVFCAVYVLLLMSQCAYVILK